MKRARISIHLGGGKFIEKGTAVEESYPGYAGYLRRGLLEDIPVASATPVEGAKDGSPPAPPPLSLDAPIGELPGVNKKIEAALIEAGIEAIEALDNFTVDDLISIEGIGEATAGKLLDELDKVKAANPSEEE